MPSRSRPAPLTADTATGVRIRAVSRFVAVTVTDVSSAGGASVALAAAAEAWGTGATRFRETTDPLSEAIVSPVPAISCFKAALASMAPLICGVLTPFSWSAGAMICRPA